MVVTLTLIFRGQGQTAKRFASPPDVVLHGSDAVRNRSFKISYEKKQKGTGPQRLFLQNFRFQNFRSSGAAQQADVSNHQSPSLDDLLLSYVQNFL